MNSWPCGAPSSHGDGDTYAALEFGAFRLVPRWRQLTLHGRPVHIGARAFDLLTLLAARAGEIVSHAELVRHAWPNRVVADCNLKAQVAALQKILGLTAGGTRHIDCVTLRGYVFIADVRRLAHVDAQSRPGSVDETAPAALPGMLIDLDLDTESGATLLDRLRQAGLRGRIRLAAY